MAHIFEYLFKAKGTLLQRGWIRAGHCFSTASHDLNQLHVPVLLEETLRELNMKTGETLLDMTFGAGGHSRAALESVDQLKILALDRDPIAQKHAHELAAQFPGQVTPLQGKFSELPKLLTTMESKKFDGILFDLGCSSMQFDEACRGFSVSKNGPLDMRMDPNTKITASDVLAYTNEQDLAKIFKIYGDEKLSTDYLINKLLRLNSYVSMSYDSKKIARAVVEARYQFKTLSTTKELCDLISAVAGFEYRRDQLMRRSHVATKVFQALRIFVNNEINELNYGLLLAHHYLRPGGRLVAIAFHSTEDRIVKRHLQGNILDHAVSSMPLKYTSYDQTYSLNELQQIRPIVWEVTTKVVLPSEREVMRNPRARSARLRAAIKLW